MVLNIPGRGWIEDRALIREVEDGCSTDGFDDIFHDSMIWFCCRKRDNLCTVVADEWEIMRKLSSLYEVFHLVVFEFGCRTRDPVFMIVIGEVPGEGLDNR